MSEEDQHGIVADDGLEPSLLAVLSGADGTAFVERTVENGFPDDDFGSLVRDMEAGSTDSDEEDNYRDQEDDDEEAQLCARTPADGLSWPERLCLHLTLPLTRTEMWTSRDGLLRTLFPTKPHPLVQSVRYYGSEAGWWRGYDGILAGSTIISFVLLFITTPLAWPALLTMGALPFWALLLLRVIVMVAASYLGGLVVLTLGLRMNYTRKAQHFAAYIIPLCADLLLEYPLPEKNQQAAYLLGQAWSYYVVIAVFATLVQPIRNRLRFVDVQFLALDRPEDRPHTLKWMTTQVVIGDSILVLFKWLFKFHVSGALSAASNLVFIPTLIVGFGDGLAEPVGITWGAHKYSTRSCACDGRKYTRSFEGSATVLVSGFFFTAVFYGLFATFRQFAACFVVLPPVMTVAEALSPHTWDTPLMMLLGCLVVIGVCFI